MEDRIEKLYISLFPENMPLLEVSEKLQKMEKHPDIDSLRKTYCNILLYAISGGYTTYNREYFKKDILIQDFLKNVKKLPQKHSFYWSLYYFYLGENSKCISFIKKDIEELQKELSGELLDEGALVEFYIEPYKNAFDGFWQEMQTLLTPVLKNDGTNMLCQLMADYYHCKINDEAVDILAEYIRKYPNITTAKEYLACTYYNLKMWNNAIACLESIEEPMIFANTKSEISFMLAWSYGKVRDYKAEEKSYRKCLEEYPDSMHALNNLGYSLYKQKRYIEAKEIFERCIEEKRDISCAVNNYVRTLIELGRYGDAKQFLKKTEYKVSKTIIEKVKLLDNSNKRLSRNSAVVSEDIEENACSIEKKVDIGSKKQQFSNEKILEDELTARLEAGMQVFGLDLKVYKRHGEYGRQYIIPCGRLDLLCEDNSGNLYIIEVKKDGGYDDAYVQTSEYLDWFEKAEKFKGKKIFGIICVNNPAKTLIEKVHADKRMRLFEYQISYTEL